MFEGKLASLGGVVAAALLGVAAPAVAAPMAQNILPFGDNRSAPTPPVARYVAIQGQSFIFDRQSAPQPLLKFDDSPEVWALEAFPAPRGDVLYRNDAGETVLRLTKLGGLILFTEQEPEGMPVALLGDADILAPLPGLPQNAAFLRIIQSGRRASNAAQHLITFDVQPYTSQFAPLVVDTAAVAADALVRMSRRADCHAFLARLDKLTITMGAKADVAINGQVMVITVAPGKGFSGRPSSDRLIKAALKH